MSPIAAEGIPVAPGEEAMIAATPAEWVDAIATLYENEKRWQSMSSRSLAFAKSNYGFEQGMRLMQQALEQVGERKSVVTGKSVSVRVDLGGSSIIKKNKQKQQLTRQT